MRKIGKNSGYKLHPEIIFKISKTTTTKNSLKRGKDRNYDA